ncbi:MAG: CoA transferase, partial [Alphaproteobacteria bacterium]
RTGRGRAVEVPMLDATFPALMAYASPYLETGVDPGRTGNRHSVPGSSPYGIYPTTDGWVAVMCVTDAHWRAFCEAVGDDELASDPALSTGRARAAQRDRIDDRLARWTSTRGRDEAIEILHAAAVPCAPVRSLAEAVDDPYLEEQGLLRRVTYEGWGEVRVLGSPIQLREGDARRADLPPTTPAPRLGEHGAEVLRDWLELGEDEVAALAGARVG